MKARVFGSYCQRCCWATHVQMMTGYCLHGVVCDRCGVVGDLAMVKLRPAEAPHDQ